MYIGESTQDFLCALPLVDTGGFPACSINAVQNPLANLAEVVGGWVNDSAFDGVREVLLVILDSQECIGLALALHCVCYIQRVCVLAGIAVDM